MCVIADKGDATPRSSLDVYSNCCGIGESVLFQVSCHLVEETQITVVATAITAVANLKELLHYPTCRAQLEVSAWSEVGRTQMTYLEIGKSG